jgi:hypothetical protein
MNELLAMVTIVAPLGLSVAVWALHVWRTNP